MEKSYLRHLLTNIEISFQFWHARNKIIPNFNGQVFFKVKHFITNGLKFEHDLNNPEIFESPHILFSSASV